MSEGANKQNCLEYSYMLRKISWRTIFKDIESTPVKHAHVFIKICRKVTASGNQW